MNILDLILMFIAIFTIVINLFRIYEEQETHISQGVLISADILYILIKCFKLI